MCAFFSSAIVGFVRDAASESKQSAIGELNFEFERARRKVAAPWE